MDAIQALSNNIKLKIDAVVLDVNLLCSDLRKVTDKVTTSEGQINKLQPVNKQLEKQVRHLTKKQTEMEAKSEDQEDRARRNNIRITGVPEGAEGHCTVKDLILNKLGLKHLLNNFTSLEKTWDWLEGWHKMEWPRPEAREWRERSRERGTPRHAQRSPVRSGAEPQGSTNARRGLRYRSMPSPEGASE
ncbi:hypothetical protein NDU88_000655 [Pleurodeles waltl]|uniref:Uncharacterized protein n=1 Tax=Pleurodeles waltl TaxID=8319 RepID=A0AAV7NA61_PLEWA|nr:hypothetical protein NDU88_000655 [Pleurodeles waltl]